MSASRRPNAAWAILVFVAACGSSPSICEEAYPVVRARTIEACLDEPGCAAWCECFETMGEGERCAPVHSKTEWDAECDEASADTLRVCLEDDEACDELIRDLLDFSCW